MNVNGIEYNVHASFICSVCNASPFQWTRVTCCDCGHLKVMHKCQNPWQHQGDKASSHFLAMPGSRAKFCSVACEIPDDGIFQVSVSLFGQRFDNRIYYQTTTSGGLISAVLERLTEPEPRPATVLNKDSFRVPTKFKRGETVLDLVKLLVVLHPDARLVDFLCGPCSNMTLSQYIMCAGDKNPENWILTTDDEKVVFQNNELLFAHGKFEEFCIVPKKKSGQLSKKEKKQKKRIRKDDSFGLPPASDYPGLKGL
jgi:hypothetical protein